VVYWFIVRIDENLEVGLEVVGAGLDASGATAQLIVKCLFVVWPITGTVYSQSLTDFLTGMRWPHTGNLFNVFFIHPAKKT
jgi:hypothetical protein